MLILVRHAMPVPEPAVPSRDWRLTAEGADAARRLRAALPAPAYLVSSSETRAWQTLGGPDREVLRDARFDEVRRPDEPWSDDVRIRRRAYVEGAEHEDWESRDAVAARWRAGVAEHELAAADRALVVGGHGMAMTVWLAATLGWDAAEAGAFWAGLEFPDALVVDRRRRTTERLTAAG